MSQINEVIQTVRREIIKMDDLLRGLIGAVNELEQRAARLQIANDEFVAVINATTTPTHAEQIVVMLTGEYKLRSMEAVCDTTGLNREAVMTALRNADVDYVLKRRIRDGAELIGLADRN